MTAQTAFLAGNHRKRERITDLIGACDDPSTSSTVERESAAAPTYRMDIHPRSGRSVEARLQARLKASPHPAVRRVRCKYEQRVLTLYGTMPSYYCVQLAISIVQGGMNGEVPIQNSLRVVPMRQRS